ncbi:sugar ABC transporter permease [Conexibacter sp. SYSU D00693]|uniref:sugar ABC transporter permease n=1 Tax=Conexibacter sp. SYSU D00693 TaxID=2812560 RepID=UPI00196B3DD4|nr:sugar ABC transporter permease [Conexibacter sp. SYSU D00693]
MSATVVDPDAPAPGQPPASPGDKHGAVTPREALRKLADGELGSVRVILMLALIWTIFTIAEDRFLTATNLTNLVLQIAAVGTISVGVVLVLLLGEIDLSVGAVSGLAGAVLAALSEKQGWGPVPAIAAALAVGALIGLFQGSIHTQLVIPSFIVTLAGLLTWQGAQLEVLGETGTINVTDKTIQDLTGTFFDPAIGWVLAAVCIALVAFESLGRRRRRGAAGLETEPVFTTAVRVGAAAAGIIVATAVLNADRGVPLAAVILIAFVAAFHYLTTRTTFGRHIYAVGGNAEAARRAGINVKRVRTIVFVLASTMAAAGGVLAASRLLAVGQASGGGDLLLLAIAGPVIAGVSLFGGRGGVSAALLGALVIGSISNGMDLLGLESSVKYMITGGVLLAAVVLDATARRRRADQGRV